MGKKRRQLPLNTQPLSDDTHVQSNHRDLKPKLIWPMFEDNSNITLTETNFLHRFIEKDSPVFPGVDVVHQNNEIYEKASRYGISLGIREFWSAFRRSTKILFVDSHFDVNHFRRMELELERISSSMAEMEISIYCRSNVRELVKYNDNLKSTKPKIYNICQIFIEDLPKKKSVHDRFAVMDGEIWHCGASIGGMHGALNAVSRGWLDEDDKLRKFFKLGGDSW